MRADTRDGAAQSDFKKLMCLGKTISETCYTHAVRGFKRIAHDV